MQKPKTMRETVDAIWYALVGVNGEGALAKMGATHDAVGVLQRLVPTLRTKTECQTIHKDEQKDADEHGERRKISAREWIMLGLTAGALAVAAIAVFRGGTP